MSPASFSKRVDSERGSRRCRREPPPAPPTKNATRYQRAISVKSRMCVLIAAALAITTVTGRDAVAAESAITTYGERNPEAPAELDLFSFLVGKWSGRKRLADGTHAEWTWIGRYVLNGMAIADELHASADGKQYLGITLRQSTHGLSSFSMSRIRFFADK